MNITYFEPFGRAWDRMKRILFQPFDINKWFVLGFTAFLAGLLDGGGGSGSRGHKYDHVDWGDVARFPNTAWEWLMDHSIWFSLILFGVVFIFALVILLNWLSSRGKFMFLDNVVHNRAKITQPWNDFKNLGNSLFVWRLIYGFIVFFIFMALLVLFFLSFLSMYDGGFPKPLTGFTVAGMVLVLLTLFVITAYISAFLDGFVVPIMYRHNLTATKAWGRFLPLLGKNFWYFILYGIIVFFLIIVVIITVILFGLMTCCIGFLFLIIPYIGSVIMLPVSVTFRAFSVEFLEQFGEDYKIFPALENSEQIK